jgi:hypothetical protein
LTVWVGISPNWPFQRSCAQWSDMSQMMRHKMVARGTLRNPSTKPVWAASFVVQILCSYGAHLFWHAASVPYSRYFSFLIQWFLEIRIPPFFFTSSNLTVAKINVVLNFYVVKIWGRLHKTLNHFFNHYLVVK